MWDLHTKLWHCAARKDASSGRAACTAISRACCELPNESPSRNTVSPPFLFMALTFFSVAWCSGTGTRRRSSCGAVLRAPRPVARGATPAAAEAAGAVVRDLRGLYELCGYVPHTLGQCKVV